MSDFDRNAAAAQYGAPLTRAEAAVVDEGLRAYMLRIYNYMVLGLAITGFAALGIYMLSVTSDLSSAAYVYRGGRLFAAASVTAVQARDVLLTSLGYTMFFTPLKWVVILAPLGLVFFLSFRVESMRPTTAQVLFWLYAALVGVSLASIFMVYTHTSITRVFFITAASFGALSLWGYTTQRDLSGWGSFLIMGLFGIIIAMLVNVGIAAFTGQSSTMLQWIISVVGVLVFAGLTAYDTQRLKSEYIYSAMEGDVLERSAIMGALSLYLDFLNLFTMLLSLLGSRDE